MEGLRVIGYNTTVQKTCQQCQAPFTIFPDEEAFLQKMTFTFGPTTIHPPFPVF